MPETRRNVFVGRAQELAVLRAALSGAAESRGRAVVLVGEPGIGKSRTAAELTLLGREHGFEVLAGRCFEGEGAPAFWPWLQVLRAFVAARDTETLRAELGASASDIAAVLPEVRARLPDLPEPPLLEPGQARFRFFEGVTTALSRAAHKRPVLLTLDDLQGMDESSLRLLGYLARTLRDTSLLVVGGARSIALAAGHPLGHALGELVREQALDLLSLEGLGEAEVETLLSQIAGEAVTPKLAAAVRARTEGNPLYVTEIARMLAARPPGIRAVEPSHLELPATVRLAIARNLSELSDPCRELLTLAALFGREFPRDALVHASGLGAQRALELIGEAEAAQVVTAVPGEPGGRRFVHSLIAETLAERPSSAQRAALHVRAAESLAADPRAEEHAAEIAHHWLEAGLAGDSLQAVEWARRAAQRALAAFAHEEAARLYRMALAALDGSREPDLGRRVELLLGLGEAHRRAGDNSQRKETFLAAASLARELDSPELLARAALGFAPPVVWGETPDADPAVIQLLEESIAAWRDADTGLHACGLARLSTANLFGDQEQAADFAERAEAMARRVGDPETLRYVLAARLTGYLRRHDPELRLSIASDLAQLAESAGDLEALAAARLWRTVHLLETGRITAMRREQAALARLARELRRPIWIWYASVTEHLCALHDGRFDDAERAIAEALRVGQSALPYAAPGYFMCAMLALRTLQGRGDELSDQLRVLFSMHPDPRSLSPLAWSESERGRRAETPALLQRLLDHGPLAGASTVVGLVTACFLAEGCAFLADSLHAETLLAIVSSHVAEIVVWADGVPLGPRAHYLGLLERTLGRLDDAAAHFETALAISARDGARPFLARSQYEYAALLRARGADGDAARARRLLADAREIAESIGMAGLCRKIDAIGESALVDSTHQLFRFDGASWTIASFGKEIRLPDMRGLRYLAELVHAPGREFHSSDLASALDATGATSPAPDPELTTVDSLGDAGEILDRRARAAYRERLTALDEELHEAERSDDLARLARARSERDALLAELRAGSSGKRAARHAERSRVAVTKAIGAALTKISAAHPELGAHLGATVRRGYFCAYVPDPRVPVRWEG